MADAKSPTYWNFEPCEARIVRVIVADTGKFPAYWARSLVGEEREAVEVTYHGTKFYLDNANGRGWLKVTYGRGGPGYSHRSLEIERVVE